MRGVFGVLVALAAAAAFLAFFGGSAAADDEGIVKAESDGPALTGVAELRDVDIGTAITECPQAGEPSDKSPKPLDLRTKDKVEQLSNGGDDLRPNQDYACFPQDETSIAINPQNPKNAVGGANDYRLGWGTSGFYATTDNGNHWYDGIKPFPTNANQLRDHIDGGGDPAIAYDREGTVYYNDLHFARENDESGIFVARSTNGGFTWSRPCVPAGSTDDAARCGGNGDVRRPGDGVVNYTPDNDLLLNGSVPFNDKNYMTTGPRPAGVSPVCFAPITKTPIPAGAPGCPSSIIGPDRLYVTWTLFSPAGQSFSTINVSYSDDRGYSWSPPRVINGSAPFCTGASVAGGCDDNQGSVPTVNPTTGFLYVAFENFNTPDENQYLMVRSRDGGQTFEGPFFVTPIFDVNYPQGNRGRQDCVARGQSSTRRVLTNTCFRVNAYGAIAADPRGGEFADDLYVVIDDNRNGTLVSSNVDVFLFKSVDGGTTWIGPTRVNNDPSTHPTASTGTSLRDCGRSMLVGPCPPGVPNYGNDQFFPWVDVSGKGDVNVVFYDRRLDTDSVDSEWPTSRQRPGNYLVWNFGAQCGVSQTPTLTDPLTSIPASARQCVAPEATLITAPTAPINPPSLTIPPGASQSAFPLRNFNVSDTASNWDYTFRAGIFAGDYNNVAIGPDSTAWAFWTDARNGRSARQQPGRNPICEQSDVFADTYSSQSGGNIGNSATQGMDLFLVTPCPLQALDKGATAP